MAVPVVMPRLGMIMTQGTVAKWLKKAGEQVRRGEPLVEVESEKATFQVESPQDGVVFLVAPEGATTPVEVVIGYVLAEGEAPPGPAPGQPAAVAAREEPRQADLSAASPAIPAAAPPAGEVRASPIAKRLASELGIDIAHVRGTGPGGRVTEADVRAHTQMAVPATPPPPVPVQAVVPIRGIRKVVGQRMQQSLRDSAQYTLTLEIDVTEMVNLRREVSRAKDDGPGTRISSLDIVIKAVAEALKRYPRLNAVLAGEEIHELGEINVGFAVALPEGLVVPVVRGADRKTVAEIASVTSDLTTRVKRGTLTLDEMTGGTFTISFLGHVDAFTPILNPPECGVLGVGRFVQKPAIYQNEIAKRWMSVLSLTLDHRVVDGQPGAVFLRRVGQYLESPGMLKGLLDPGRKQDT